MDDDNLEMPDKIKSTNETFEAVTPEDYGYNNVSENSGKLKNIAAMDEENVSDEMVNKIESFDKGN